MGFPSSNHLLTALKSQPVERDFAQYIEVLKVEALSQHQMSLSENLIERIRIELTE
jgi:hypothetical protein